MKLNLGCSGQVINGWINVDYALGCRFAKFPFFNSINKKLGLFDQIWDNRIFIHNLKKTFPWPDQSVECIYASHILEHFTKEEGIRLLQECFRVLKKDGIIRIIVPDLAVIVQQYQKDKIKAENFLEEIDVLYRTYPNKLKTYLAPFIQFPHKCMYDFSSLQRIATQIGFSKIEKKQGFDSQIFDIKMIELENRVQDAVIFEAKKP